ncbi:MAG: SHOCT domain-containing protein [Proteobacteria bacterium]|nr:SHOCT domain-containing protein [Pseudomonadota bacterium]
MMGYGMYGYGGIMWLIVIALAIVAIYIFVRLAGKGRAVGGVTTETPLEILKKRYARGEISREQFEEMKKDIGT